MPTPSACMVYIFVYLPYYYCVFTIYYRNKLLIFIFSICKFERNCKLLVYTVLNTG